MVLRSSGSSGRTNLLIPQLTCLFFQLSYISLTPFLQFLFRHPSEQNRFLFTSCHTQNFCRHSPQNRQIRLRLRFVAVIPLYYTSPCTAVANGLETILTLNRSTYRGIVNP